MYDAEASLENSPSTLNHSGFATIPEERGQDEGQGHGEGHTHDHQ